MLDNYLVELNENDAGHHQRDLTSASPVGCRIRLAVCCARKVGERRKFIDLRSSQCGDCLTLHMTQWTSFDGKKCQEGGEEHARSQHIALNKGEMICEWALKGSIINRLSLVHENDMSEARVP